MIKKEVRTLPNGLTLVCVSNDEKHYIGASIYIKYGSAIKDFKVNGKEYHFKDGIAHLLEHVLIDESVYGNVGKLFFENNVEFNGTTGSRRTKFYINTYENFEEHFVKLMNLVNNAVFTPQSIEHSKGPVYEEIRRKKDDRFFDFNIELTKSLYKKPELLTGVGEIDDVASFNFDDLSTIYNAFYKPSNEIVSVYGNFDIDKIVELVEKTYASFDREYLDVEVDEYKEDKEVNRKYYEITKEEEYPYVEIDYKIPVDEFNPIDKMLIPMVVSDFINCNFSRKSELYMGMIKDNITKFSVYNGYHFACDNKYVIINIEVRTDQVDEAVKRVNKVFEEKKPIPYRNFDIAKKKRQLSYLYSEDSPKRFADGYVENVLYFDYHEFDKYEDLDLLTYEKSQEIMCKLDFSNYTVMVRKNK